MHTRYSVDTLSNPPLFWHRTIRVAIKWDYGSFDRRDCPRWRCIQRQFHGEQIQGSLPSLSEACQILLGVWGPIITSVGNLLTIVLVLFADVLFGGGAAITIWGLAGSGVIVAAFGILVYDMFNR